MEQQGADGVALGDEQVHQEGALPKGDAHLEPGGLGERPVDLPARGVPARVGDAAARVGRLLAQGEGAVRPSNRAPRLSSSRMRSGPSFTRRETVWLSESPSPAARVSLA